MLSNPSFPAITLYQPWATLVAEGLKPFEFRSWPAPNALVGRRVAIHASARPVKRAEVLDLFDRLGNREWRLTGLVDRTRAMRLLNAVHDDPKILPLASVLCLATLGKPIRNSELAAAMGLPADSDRDEHSNWGWPLTDVTRLKPFVPARGKQGWWHWMPPKEMLLTVRQRRAG